MHFSSSMNGRCLLPVRSLPVSLVAVLLKFGCSLSQEPSPELPKEEEEVFEHSQRKVCKTVQLGGKYWTLWYIVYPPPLSPSDPFCMYMYIFSFSLNY